YIPARAFVFYPPRRFSMFRTWLPLLLVVLSCPLQSAADAAKADGITLKARSRESAAPGLYRETEQPMTWAPKETAIVICDMWDKHWCNCATQRVAEMAPKMNAVVKNARARGVYIIHAPSDCMAFYKDAPQRQLALSA